MRNIKNRTIAIIVASILLTVTVLLSILLPLLLPRNGADRYQIWSPYDTIERTDFIEVDMPSDNSAMRVLQLTDVQIDSPGEKTDIAFADITKLIESQKPHLIILTGDNVQGVFNDKSLKRLVKHIDSFKIPWTLTWGNHDAEGRSDRAYLSEIVVNLDSEYCLYEAGPSNIKGYGNHVVNIVNGDELVYSMQLIDSNRNIQIDAKTSAYDYIGYDQIAYFEYMHEQSELIYGQDVKSMAFYHIPPVEVKTYYNELMKKYHPEYKGEGKAPILKADEVPGILFGEFREPVFSSSHNSGIMDSGLVTNTTHSFVGHDHVNNASIMVGAQQVTYGMKLGVSSYHNKDMQGGTMIYINADGTVSVEHKNMSELN